MDMQSFCHSNKLIIHFTFTIIVSHFNPPLFFLKCFLGGVFLFTDLFPLTCKHLIYQKLCILAEPG